MNKKLILFSSLLILFPLIGCSGESSDNVGDSGSDSLSSGTEDDTCTRLARASLDNAGIDCSTDPVQRSLAINNPFN